MIQRPDLPAGLAFGRVLKGQGKEGVGQESEGMRSKYGLELVLCFPREKIGKTE